MKLNSMNFSTQMTQIIKMYTDLNYPVSRSETPLQKFEGEFICVNLDNLRHLRANQKIKK